MASENGILFSTYCEQNRVVGNTVVTSNKSALFLYTCSNNIFYHNSFINMTRPAFNINSTNAWNSSLGEGNYWSAYTGAFNATRGIGLEPYVVDVGNVDYYPLRRPYIAGDANHDGTVNATDADTLRMAWQWRQDDAGYNPHVDFNMDGIINIQDASIIGVNWQKTTLFFKKTLIHCF